MRSYLGATANMELRDRLVSLVDALSALRTLTLADIENLTEPEVLEEALTALTRHQDLESCSVFLREGDDLYCAAGTRFDEELAAGRNGIKVWSGSHDDSMRFGRGEGMVGIACETRQLQYCRNCHTDERFKPFADAGDAHAVGSLISVPICCGEEVIGVLNVSHPIPEHFEPWHQHMLLLFCSMLGQMLHIGRLLRKRDNEVSARVRELEQALKESDELKRRYEKLSTIDELTELYNRRYFFSEAESLLAHAIRHDLPFTMLVLDVDHFKRINDRWGHVVGDGVLRKIASVLQAKIRAGDLVARLGGEEFAIVLLDTKPEKADLLADRIQQDIRLLDIGDGPDDMEITVSIGMTARCGREGDDLEALLDVLYAEADEAMYQCKRDGRNRRLFYKEQYATGDVA
ncbi:MAG TPA: GGDEF domain-containing protein [Sedimenticola sp.]|nr:GGDEF domain-containing protein [Sedimenticola sp.]